MRKKPKFRIGDTVKICRTGQIVQVTNCIYQESRTTPAINAYVNGKTSVVQTTLKEDWLYKLSDGRSWRFSEECLESATECPNCGAVGWDWVTGCGKCGLSPEDFN